MLKRSSSVKRWLLKISLICTLVACANPVPAAASVPDWFRTAARGDLPPSSQETTAVVLFSEQVTTVASGGQVKTTYRRVYKILRPQGRKDYGTFAVYFDADTR